jgi:hypothetical protein
MICDLYSTDHRSQIADHPLVMLLPSITPITTPTILLSSYCLNCYLILTLRDMDVLVLCDLYSTDHLCEWLHLSIPPRASGTDS